MSCPYGDDGCQGLRGRRVCMRCAFDTARAMDRENIGGAFEAMRRRKSAPTLSVPKPGPPYYGANPADYGGTVRRPGGGAVSGSDGHIEAVHAPSKGLPEPQLPIEYYDRRQALLGVLERLPEPQRGVAQRAWSAIQQISPNISLPTCGINDDEGALDYGHMYFGWNPGPYTLDVTISPLGDVTWFFVDHRANVHVTSDETPGDGYLGFVGLFTRTEYRAYSGHPARDRAIGVCGWCKAPLVNYNEICTCRRTGVRSRR